MSRTGGASFRLWASEFRQSPGDLGIAVGSDVLERLAAPSVVAKTTDEFREHCGLLTIEGVVLVGASVHPGL